MMHPYAAVTGYFDENLESFSGQPATPSSRWNSTRPNFSRGFVRGAKWQVMPSGGPLGMRAAYGGKPLEEAWGVNLHRNTKRVFGRSFEWGIIAEDLPDEANRVPARHPDRQRRRHRAQAHLQKPENTQRLIDFHLKRAAEAMRASGAIDMSITPLMRDCGWHLMGTARMGIDPAK